MLLFSGCLVAADNGVIRGRVLDAAGGPLVGASVTLRRLRGGAAEQTTRTDDRGAYDFKNLSEGEYRVVARCQGFGRKSVEPVIVSTSAQVQTDFQLEVAYNGSEGAITWESILDGELKQGNIRVEGARLCLVQPNSSHGPFCTVTNKTGWYTLTVQPAVYNLTVHLPSGVEIQDQLDMRKPAVYRDKITIDRNR